jgi:hypothetical protein
MTFFVLALIAIYLALIVRKYKSARAVIITIAVINGLTTSLLVWGLHLSHAGERLIFFNSGISRNEFYFLVAAWYVVDIVCSIKIIRNHIEYKKINRNK